MKTNLLPILALACLLPGKTNLTWGAEGAFRMAPELDPKNPPAMVRTPNSLPSALQPTRVVLRGWEIESIQAITRPLIAEVFPSYKGGVRGADQRLDRPPKNGTFLVLEVKVKWATSQPPSERLWVGKPDPVLVDKNGSAFDVVDSLTRKGNVYFTKGMVTGAEGIPPGPTPPTKDRFLIYFDVESAVQNSQSYWLQFSVGGPLVQVDQVPDLPDTAAPALP